MTDDYARGWNDCREAIAKLVDVSAERPAAWDWRRLPGIIRSITPAAPSTPTGDASGVMAEARRFARNTPQPGQTGPTQEAISKCERCGGMGVVVVEHDLQGRVMMYCPDCRGST